ncbi:MAG: PstS family phosphate ABC transporter substrate-binding protein [Alphaproteobacteria bacterium]|nr:PstS family phosphate ABC transporter substrate-binding protein [Alphaproteobacteria bacterium]
MNRLSALSILGLLGMSMMTPAYGFKRSMIAIDGSSTAYPITEAVAEEFQLEQKGAAAVTVGIAGTGGGFKRFCKGDIDITQASRPISEAEMLACKTSGIEYIELPIALDALTVAVSPKNKTLECITIAQLKKIWEPSAQGTVLTWKDVDTSWPDVRLNLYGAGSDSGTFDYFTEATVGKAKASRGDYTASENDNVIVTGIANDPFALGYIPYSYYSGNAAQLKPLKVDGGKGCVLPSIEAAQDGSYSPLSRPLFLYVSKQSADTNIGVRDFIHYYLTKGQPLVTEVHYLPLPAEVYTKLLARFEARTTGTVFGGHAAIGVSIHDIIERETVH